MNLVTVRRARTAALVALALALSACSSAADPADTDSAAPPAAAPNTASTSAPSSEPSEPSSPSSSAATPSSAAPSRTPIEAPEAKSPYTQCGIETPKGVTEKYGYVEYNGSQIYVAEMGKGSTTVVLLPQVNGGSCGWWMYGGHLATTYPVRVVAVDSCYGGGWSQCQPEHRSDFMDSGHWAVEYAKRTGGPETKVVVVGASAGGSIAARLATEEGVTSAVDVSGPPVNYGGDLEADAPKAQVPLLVIGTMVDGKPLVDRMMRAVKDSGNDKVYGVVSQQGHGWDALYTGSYGEEKLTPEGKAIGLWIMGDYAGAKKLLN